MPIRESPSGKEVAFNVGKIPLHPGASVLVPDLMGHEGNPEDLPEDSLQHLYLPKKVVQKHGKKQPIVLSNGAGYVDNQGISDSIYML